MYLENNYYQEMKLILTDRKTSAFSLMFFASRQQREIIVITRVFYEISEYKSTLCSATLLISYIFKEEAETIRYELILALLLVILDLQLDFLHFFRFFESSVNLIPPGLSVCSLVGRNFDHMRAVFQ